MAEFASRERLQPALLDRLTDDAPDQRRESFDQQTLTMPQLRRAVLRDLAWLLNVTNLATTQDLAGLPRAAASSVNYGIPGFAGLLEQSGRLDNLEAPLAEAIRRYEPRIRPETLRVRSRPNRGENVVPALVFEISCELWAQPLPIQLFLESSIELETGQAVVTDAPARD